MKPSRAELTRRLNEVEEEFVGLWRTMSSLWGISPTMAEIHGLLYITGAALSMDDIMARLSISRGNVSMNLSKLVEWGLVKRVHQRGDRRDYYASLGDVWEIFTLVAAQRKRREIDPILSTPLPGGAVAGEPGRRRGPPGGPRALPAGQRPVRLPVADGHAGAALLREPPQPPRRGRAAGAGELSAHDPADGPGRRAKRDDFLAAWATAGYRGVRVWIP